MRFLHENKRRCLFSEHPAYHVSSNIAANVSAKICKSLFFIHHVMVNKDLHLGRNVRCYWTKRVAKNAFILVLVLREMIHFSATICAKTIFCISAQNLTLTFDLVTSKLLCYLLLTL